ncbi:hypothetical protein RAS1_09290 [Phycisphaerae bacterium RAS1]|nr:hypothetical protein RAS1_09290 [Phycisphaerae bacterium RAS1]
MPDTIAYTPAKLDNTTAEGRSGATHAGGQVFDDYSLTPKTATTNRAQRLREMQLLFERMWAFLMQLRAEHVSGLNIAVNPGAYRKSDNSDVWFAGSASFAADDNATRYVWIDTATNGLAKGAAWPGTPHTFVPICRVIAASGVVTEIRDYSNLLKCWLVASGAAVSGTDATTFVLDQDNAGAPAATSGVKGNRGTGGAGEKWYMRWTEASELFDFLAKDTALTLATINALALKISGTTMVDSNGAAKVAAAVAGDGLSHSSGALVVNVDSATVEINSDALRVKDGGVTAAKLSAAVQGDVPYATVNSLSSADDTKTVQVRLKDLAGAALADDDLIEVGVYADAALAATHATATLSNTPSAGTFANWVTSNKEARYRADSGGSIDVALSHAGVNGTVYVGLRSTRGGRHYNCQVVGVFVKA